MYFFDRLSGHAKFQKDIDGMTNVLHLPSSTVSYAETPSYDIRGTDFTVSFWAKLTKGGYVYSRWGGPHHFAVGVWDKSFVMHVINEYQRKDASFK